MIIRIHNADFTYKLMITAEQFDFVITTKTSNGEWINTDFTFRNEIKYR